MPFPLPIVFFSRKRILHNQSAGAASSSGNRVVLLPSFIDVLLKDHMEPTDGESVVQIHETYLPFCAAKIYSLVDLGRMRREE